MAERKQKFIATRSKAKALRDAEAAGINAPIAVKVPGGFVVYQGYAKNPATKRVARKSVSKKRYIERPSQITRKPPSKRLKARRKKMEILADAGYTGVYPNPAVPTRKRGKAMNSIVDFDGKPVLIVQENKSKEWGDGVWVAVAYFPDTKVGNDLAPKFAHAYAKKHGVYVRVVRN